MHMKKIILTALILISIILFQSPSQAQEEGLGDVIIEDQTPNLTEHGFLINELSYTAIKLHLLIAGKDLQTINYQGEALETIKNLEVLTKTNVITLLDLAKNKETALTQYLTTCEQGLQKGEMLSSYIKQETNIIKGDMEACIKDKEISDKAYFDAIDRYDQKSMNTAVSDSIKYEQCATKKRIEYNAKATVAKKLVFYMGLLQKKYDVLFEKKDILAKNFEIFRDNILPDLNDIDDLLKQYDF